MLVLTNIFEKPSFDLLKKEKLHKQKKYFAAFGEYILNKKFLNIMKEYRKNNPNKEIPFTELINEYIKDDSVYAFIPSGKMYDVGNIESYRETINKYKDVK